MAKSYFIGLLNVTLLVSVQLGHQIRWHIRVNFVNAKSMEPG